MFHNDRLGESGWTAASDSLSYADSDSKVRVLHAPDSEAATRLGVPVIEAAGTGTGSPSGPLTRKSAVPVPTVLQVGP